MIKRAFAFAVALIGFSTTAVAATHPPMSECDKAYGIGKEIWDARLNDNSDAIKAKYPSWDKVVDLAFKINKEDISSNFVFGGAINTACRDNTSIESKLKVYGVL